MKYFFFTLLVLLILCAKKEWLSWAFEENIKGTLSRGMLADFAVLDTDLFSTAPEQWLKAKVDLTIVGGEVVFRK